MVEMWEKSSRVLLDGRLSDGFWGFTPIVSTFVTLFPLSSVAELKYEGTIYTGCSIDTFFCIQLLNIEECIF